MTGAETPLIAYSLDGSVLRAHRLVRASSAEMAEDGTLPAAATAAVTVRPVGGVSSRTGVAASASDSRGRWPSRRRPGSAGGQARGAVSGRVDVEAGRTGLVSAGEIELAGLFAQSVHGLRLVLTAEPGRVLVWGGLPMWGVLPFLVSGARHS